jgi:two-component system, OmpR family, sensor histidine kinase SenX3
VGIVWLLVGVVLGGAVVWAVLSGAARQREGATASDPLPIEPVTVAPSPGDDRLRQALDAIELGVVICDASGEVVLRNGAATRSGAVHTDALVEEAVDAIMSRARDGEVGRRVLDLFGPPAQVLVVSGSPLADGGAIVTISDETERSRLDSVRTDFVANVSHELKTPVGAIAVLAEALMDETDLDVVHRFASKMVAEAHRVGSTIDDLLELSRIELGGEMVRQSVDVNRVIAEAIERVEAEATQRRIRISVECETATNVDGDARQLVSAVGNLVENAVKYSDDGSTVTVGAGVDGDEIRISVSDTGVGIPNRDLGRVFERFYRVDRARSRVTGGTGLGLSIVRHVATNHGGRVTVTSREGEGSTFTLSLPRADGGAR